MGRSKKFNQTEALDAAMGVFWRKGYENTSVQDLLDVMNIQPGSFYHSFGDKKSLFKKVVDHYNGKLAHRGEIVVKSGDAKQAIRGFFKDFYGLQKNKTLPKGCLVGRSYKRNVLDDELNDYLESSLTWLNNAFKDKIQESFDNGKFESKYSAKELSLLVFTHLQGLIRVVDLDIPLPTLERQTDLFLESLGL